MKCKIVTLLFCLVALPAMALSEPVSVPHPDWDLVFSQKLMSTPPLKLAQAPVTPTPKVNSGGTTNTVETTGPVTSTTTFSFGTLAGQVLTWLAAAFSIPLGLLGTLWIKRLFTLAGVQVTQQMSDQLNTTLLNGLNDGASKANAMLQGQATVEVKNQIVANAIDYAQRHKAETIQALGLDPQSGEAVEALKARIATLIADPKAPTPIALDAVPKPVQPAAPLPRV